MAPGGGLVEASGGGGASPEWRGRQRRAAVPGTGRGDEEGRGAARSMGQEGLPRAWRALSGGGNVGTGSATWRAAIGPGGAAEVGI